jgi:hypothetical protein
VVQTAQQWGQARLNIHIATMCNSVPSSREGALLLGCGYSGCKNLDGPSEAGLVTNRRGVLCSGCGVVRFCNRFHARLAWPAHRLVCGRLAAARNGLASNSSSNQALAATLAAAVPTRGLQEATAGVAASANTGGSSSGASSSSSAMITSCSSNNDVAAARDQLLGSSGRVCSWCGKAAPNLLRCAGCKVAWYCGADHQRAAWKAGHKQECGAAAAAAPGAQQGPPA